MRRQRGRGGTAVMAASQAGADAAARRRQRGGSAATRQAEGMCGEGGSGGVLAMTGVLGLLFCFDRCVESSIGKVVFSNNNNNTNNNNTNNNNNLDTKYPRHSIEPWL